MSTRTTGRQQSNTSDRACKPGATPEDCVSVARRVWGAGRGLGGWLGRDRMMRLGGWIRTRVSWSRGAEERGKRALRILEARDQIVHVGPGHYRVGSQTRPGHWYDVKRVRSRWVCDCGDHVYRKAQCKHILAVSADAVDREAVAIMGEPPGQAVDQAHTPQQQQQRQKEVAGGRGEAQPVLPAGAEPPAPEAGGRHGREEGEGEAQEAAPGGGAQPASRPQRPSLSDITDPRADPDGVIHIRPIDDAGPPLACRRCGLTEFTKYGFHPDRKDGTRSRRYKCSRCGRTRINRGGMERMRQTPDTVCDIFDHYNKGHSDADIADTLGRRGTTIHRSSVYRIRKKFAPLLESFTDGLQLNHLGERFHADEIYEVIRGVTYCIFGVTERETRFLLAYDVADRKDGYNAARLLASAERRAGKKPSELVTDGLDSYAVAFEKLYAPKNPLDKHSTHISDAGVGKKENRQKNKYNNNVQERFNSTQRACYRPRRGIKSTQSPVFPGFSVWYNFIRVHSAIRCTPAEAAGIMIHGNDKWKTLIGNACVAALGA